MQAFKIHKGKWLLKDFLLDQSAGDIVIGDMIGIDTEHDQTCEKGSSSSACILGISAGDYPDDSSGNTKIKVWVPNEPKAEMKGRITDGTVVIGTDVNRPCDLEDHQGADVDDHTHDHLFLVRVTKVGTNSDAAQTEAEGVFRIVQIPEYSGAF